MICERRWLVPVMWVGALGWATGSPAPVSAAPMRVLGAAAQQGPAEDPRVTKRFAEAVRLYKQGKAAQALPMFQSVAAESGSPNAHLYVGHCLVQERRYVEAHHAFSVTVKEIGKRSDDKYEATREAAQAQLSWLSARIAKLVVSPTEFPPRLVVKVDGEELATSALGAELALAPGTHRVEATAEGVSPVVRDIEIGSGESKTIALAFQRLDTARSGVDAAPTPAHEATDHRGTYRLLGFVAGGVGVAGLAVFTVAGLKAKSTYDELDRDCAGGACANTDDERIDRGKTQQTLANVGLVTGLVGIAASGALLYLGFSGSSRAEASVAFTPERATVACRLRF